MDVISSHPLSESEQIIALRRELHWAQLKIQVLEEKLRLQRIKKYGPGSEKLSDAQLELLEWEPGVSTAEVQAESERERRAKVIHAEGELQASEKLLAAANVISENPQALQLRYLQTLNDISNENVTTVVFPLPIDLIEAFGIKIQKQGQVPA